ncbi:P1 family peptidase [Candidatus Palauibacter soopunensis]|uniref:P1 family peptidase n=1 Tax=Candidatus Palauibacter soopunensis TaxID=3056739 RepID=UPI0023A4EE12|nr:P1 family peptidase [Candidatus Palauibacter soopunensis]MDE2878091.1 P1 family peptidase [Candidatus Palauibacter soopunensis]
MRPELPGPRSARGVALVAAGVLGGFLAAGGCVAQETADSAGGGITAIEGLALGHFTLEERPTGCTVVLAEGGAVAGVDVRGGAPGTREIALLDPVNSVQEAHAIVLSGGSAFGLDAASGVVRYLEERGIGYRAGDHVVPIVAAAILFDLGIGGGSVRPGPECGYEAARAASADPPAEGSVGAGAGATVGKLRGRGRAMKGGIGTASITLEDGLTVAAVVAVNAVGDVIDPATGEVVAGVRTEDGTGFADARALIREGEARPPGDVPDDASVENTTIGVVATNARLSKAEITKVAQMAHDGLARAIYPAHTPSDGDTLFGLATGTHTDDAGVARIGALAADMVAEAILRAVRTATGLTGLPSVSDLTDTGN